VKGGGKYNISKDKSEHSGGHNGVPEKLMREKKGESQGGSGLFSGGEKSCNTHQFPPCI